MAKYQLGYVSGEYDPKDYWSHMLTIDADTKHLFYEGRNTKIDLNIPKRIELLRMRLTSRAWLIYGITAVLYFGFFILGGIFIPSQYWPIGESATGYVVLGIILFVFMFPVMLRSQKYLKITYASDGTEQIKSIHLSTFLDLCRERDMFFALYVVCARIFNRQTGTNSGLYQYLQKYYFS